MIASLHLGDPHWLPAAAALLVLSLIVLAWGYRQARGRAGTLPPAMLKALSLAALALFLLDPQWVSQHAQPRANLFITLVDDSQSLRVSDRDQPATRGQQLKAALLGDGGDADPAAAGVATWSLRLDEQFDTRRYAFDSRLRSLDDFAALTFDGRGSALAASLRTIADRYRGRPVAGILLFTDGHATDLTDGAIDLTGLPPIYPVVVGNQPAADVGIAGAVVSQSAFEDAPVIVQADVSAHGFAGKNVVGQLLDETNKVAQQVTMKADGDRKTLAFRFQLKPALSGLSFYRLRVGEEEAMRTLPAPLPPREGPGEGGIGKPTDIGDPDAQPGAATRPSPNPSLGGRGIEATLANNEQLLAVDRGRGPYRVLYVCGRPNWEFKFLNRAAAADPQLKLVGLIRIAKKETKVAFRDGRVEEVNPLFRGFDNKNKEQVEQYDEPVLVRLNALDDAELRGGFPKSAEELFRYHAIVLDDLEAAFFTRDQLSLIEKFVTDRRGGLLMLGGAESLREGDYARTPIGRMLPVYLDRPAEARLDARYRIELTRAGWHEPWVRLRGTEDEERQRLAAMPRFATLNAAPGVKPGATVLANAVDDQGGTFPALIVQSFGGRVAVATVGDYWRWAIKREEANEDVFKMWRQTSRWLVADVPDRVMVTAQPQRQGPDAPVKISIRARGKEYGPADNAAVTIKVQPAGGEAVTLRAEPSLDEPGLYEATYLPRTDGAYRTTAKVIDAKGDAIGEAEAGWVTHSAAAEFRSLEPNRALLELIATTTGGQIVKLDDLEGFVAGLPSRKAPVMETSVQPLWHRWWMLGLALACLVGEWGLRRMRGLP